VLLVSLLLLDEALDRAGRGDAPPLRRRALLGGARMRGAAVAAAVATAALSLIVTVAAVDAAAAPFPAVCCGAAAAAAGGVAVAAAAAAAVGWAPSRITAGRRALALYFRGVACRPGRPSLSDRSRHAPRSRRRAISSVAAAAACACRTAVTAAAAARAGLWGHTPGFFRQCAQVLLLHFISITMLLLVAWWRAPGLCFTTAAADAGRAQPFRRCAGW
jgi:hypothetical protein